MKLIFAGTPDFAAQALRALINAGHDVALVLTQPDRPSGRGMKLTASAVKTTALAHGLLVEQPVSLKEPGIQARLASIAPDVMVVAAYGLLLPNAILTLPRVGCLNIHASLLPRWRGAAPIQRALLAGDSETGITIMEMDSGLDTGPILRSYPLTIDERETGATLNAKLAALGAQAIVSTLAELDRLNSVPQPTEGITYAGKLTKQEARIDWKSSAKSIVRAIRAFNPSPGAHTMYGGTLLKLWDAYAVPGQGAAGHIVATGAQEIMVASGAGLVAVTELQRAGSRRLSAAEFILGFPELIGKKLG